ncbi:MAG: hypothetical protein EBY37_07000 [Flavobacteriia bacterium]|jgi:hypothetical protein|nr:hypothetical protein [Flavobacteriia bacterium]
MNLRRPIKALTSLSLKEQFLYSVVAYIIVYIFWYDVILNHVTAGNDMGSLIFLPHGVRYLVILAFGWVGFWAIFFGSLVSPMINEEIVKLNPNPWTDYINIWHNLESFAGALSVLAVVAFLYWAKIIDQWKGKLYFMEPSKLMLIVISSALLNGLFSNFITSQSSLGVDTNPIRIIRFIAGDIIGALLLLLAAFVLYRIWVRYIAN